MDSKSAVSSGSGWSLRRRLFSYMLILVCLLIVVLIAVLIIGDQFSSVSTHTYDLLDMQMKIFERDIDGYFDTIAAKGIALSREVSALLDEYLTAGGMEFDDLADNPEGIAALQELLIGRLILQLEHCDCSGVYVMFDTTVNSSIENSESSRTGLYLQTNGYNSSYGQAVLLRGNPDIGRANGISPHRKWRLEFITDNLPGYDSIVSGGVTPITGAYRFTEMFSISGTDTQIMLLSVPVADRYGEYCGICGFEISESYFMANYAQPSGIDNMTYLFAPCSGNTVDAEKGLSSGIYDGYYREPHGMLTVKNEGKSGLSVFSGDDISYVGIIKNVSLSPNNPDYSLSVMMRKADYDNAVAKQGIKKLAIGLIFICIAVLCCYYFSQRFIFPILKSLEQLKNRDECDAVCDIPEIADLFEFLAENDREHEATMNALESKKHEAEAEKESLMQEFDRMHREYLKLQSELSDVSREHHKTQTEFDKARIELERLAYSHQAEINPGAYAQFVEGLQMLTPTERKIFNYYLDGMGIKEIAAASSVKESTIYTHNKNIYSKLGINSLKQLLRYAALYCQQERENGTIVP